MKVLIFLFFINIFGDSLQNKKGVTPHLVDTLKKNIVKIDSTRKDSLDIEKIIDKVIYDYHKAHKHL